MVVEVKPEVEQWIESLSVRKLATVVAAEERLAEDGSRLRFPAPRALGHAVMARPTIEELRDEQLKTMNANESAEFDEARDAREAAGLTQRDHAARMSTSQAAVARLEAGGTSATLPTLHKAAAALDMTITVNLTRAR